MAIQPNKERPEEKAATEEAELKKENERWRDYAGALMIAMPILLGALAISGLKTTYSIISAVTGVLGIISVVLWYGRDKTECVSINNREYPLFLFSASCLFAIQAAFLCFAFLIIP